MAFDKEVNDWRLIPGYDYPYEINYDGRVRRPLKNGKYRYLTTYRKRHYTQERLVVKLTKNGKGREPILAQLVAEAFIGPRPAGHGAYHINGCQTDNWASNIAYADKKKLGELTGMYSNKKSVAKLDRSGEMVDVYRSAREAGKANYMSYQTIIDRCNGCVKSAFAPDGFAYAWEDIEVSMRNALVKIEKEVGYLPKARLSELDFEW